MAVGIRTAEDNLIENLDTVNLDEYTTYRSLSQAMQRGKTQTQSQTRRLRIAKTDFKSVRKTIILIR